MSKFADELIESMQQAADHTAGRKIEGLRLSKIKVPASKEIKKAVS